VGQAVVDDGSGFYVSAWPASQIVIHLWPAERFDERGAYIMQGIAGEAVQPVAAVQPFMGSSSGDFVVRVPAGRYMLSSIYGVDSSWGSSPVMENGKAKVVQVNSGQAIDVGTLKVPVPQPATVKGRLLKTRGSDVPFSGEALLLTPALCLLPQVAANCLYTVEADDIILTATTDAEGNFEFNNVPPSAYILLRLQGGEFPAARYMSEDRKELVIPQPNATLNMQSIYIDQEL